MNVGMMWQLEGRDQVMRGRADLGVGDARVRQDGAVRPEGALDGGRAGLAHAGMQDEGLARGHQPRAFAASR